MIDIKGQILAAFGGMLGVCEHIKLNIYSRRANKMQKTCIKRLMRKNKSTVYGKLNNFKDELIEWCNKGYDYIGALGLFTKILSEMGYKLEIVKKEN